MQLIFTILCIITIFVLIVYNDAEDKDCVTKCIWVPTIWFLYCSSRPISYWLGSTHGIRKVDEYFIAPGNPVERNFLTLLIILAIIILIKRRSSVKYIIKSNIALVSLMFFALISLFWSDFPEISSKRIIRLFGDVIMVFVITTEEKPLSAIKMVLRRNAYILIPLSVLFIKYYRNLGVAYTIDGSTEMWIGVTTHKNDLGVLAMISGLFLVTNIFERWKSQNILTDILLLLFVMWLLYGSGSSSSVTSVSSLMIGLLVIMGNLLFYDKIRNKNQVYLISLLAIIFFMVIVNSFLEIQLYKDMLSIAGRDSTLTGRTELWEDLLFFVKQKLLLGYGFGAFWLGNRVDTIWTRHIWKPMQSHNGYIEVILDIGLIGLGVLCILIIRTYKVIFNNLYNNKYYSSLFLALFIITLISNYTEASFLKQNNVLWFLFIMIGISINTGETSTVNINNSVNYQA